jgi:hypothetical protein
MSTQSSARLDTPVALFLFNRPATTARVFARIREARPRQLYLIADGPRPTRATDAALCREARSCVAEIDWDCSVLRNYADDNLGCRGRIVTGMRWLFEQVQEAIIVEDDCLPDLSFFPFCAEMLSRYREDERVVMVSGDNFLRHPRRNADSYYFSRLAQIWGWATWRRAWIHYDPELRQWPQMRRERWLDDLLIDPKQVRLFSSQFDMMCRDPIDTWDSQWQLSVFAQGGLSVIPGVNLIENIGFGPDATHTKALESVVYERARSIGFPLQHPMIVAPDRVADRETFERRRALVPRLRARARSVLRQAQHDVRGWARKRRGAGSTKAQP